MFTQVEQQLQEVEKVLAEKYVQDSDMVESRTASSRRNVTPLMAAKMRSLFGEGEGDKEVGQHVNMVEMNKEEEFVIRRGMARGGRRV